MNGSCSAWNTGQLDVSIIGRTPIFDHHFRFDDTLGVRIVDTNDGSRFHCGDKTLVDRISSNGRSDVAAITAVVNEPAQPRREGFGPVKLFVGSLSSDTTSNDLRTAFAKFGELVDAAVINERATNQSRGFGCVTFATSTAAEAAIKEMNGVELDGRNIRVNRAEEPRFR